MMLRRLAICLGIIALFLAFGLSVNAQEEGISSVCIVTGGGRVNDGTFNQFAYEGMKLAEEEFGLNTTYVEPQAPVDYRPAIDGCIQEGYEVIIGVGWTIYDDTLAAARENPEVYFIGVDHFDTAGLPNYVGLDFRDDQAGFLMGALAAQVTETNIIAAVYGPDVPQVVRFRNGYEQGAKYINPDIQVLGVYLDSFETPDRGASTAAQFIGDGADVIFGVGGPTGTGAITYAAGEGVWVIGVDQDEYVTSFNNGEVPGADKVLSSAIKRIDVAVYSMLEVLANGDFENFPGGSNAVFSAENGGVDFAAQHEADVPVEYYEKLREIIDLFASGELDTGVDLATGELIENIMPEATEESGS